VWNLEPERKQRARGFLAWRALKEFNDGIRELAVDDFMDANVVVDWEEDEKEDLH
jgi:hypothetical protein